MLLAHNKHCRIQLTHPHTCCTAPSVLRDYVKVGVSRYLDNGKCSKLQFIADDDSVRHVRALPHNHSTERLEVGGTTGSWGEYKAGTCMF